MLRVFYSSYFIANTVLFLIVDANCVTKFGVTEKLYKYL